MVSHHFGHGRPPGAALEPGQDPRHRADRGRCRPGARLPAARSAPGVEGAPGAMAQQEGTADPGRGRSDRRVPAGLVLLPGRVAPGCAGSLTEQTRNRVLTKIAPEAVWPLQPAVSGWSLRRSG